jgi:hypothetical protein
MRGQRHGESGYKTASESGLECRQRGFHGAELDEKGGFFVSEIARVAVFGWLRSKPFFIPGHPIEGYLSPWAPASFLQGDRPEKPQR